MSQRGFTLIEMAMVIVLIGLIVSGGLFALAPILDKAKTNQTNATLDQVESALELFAIRYSRLPCPADGSLANIAANSGTYGLEQGGGATGCSVPVTNAVIPWKTLGLDESYSLDGWNNRLSYWTSGMPNLGTGAVTSTAYLTRTGSSYPAFAGITVTDVVSGQAVTPDPTKAGTPNQYDQAAYVLVSHGKSGWYSWPKNNTAFPVLSAFQALFPGGAKQCNSSPTTCTIKGVAVPNSFVTGGPVGLSPPRDNTYFDDIVRWRSASFIIQLCGSGGPCGNP